MLTREQVQRAAGETGFAADTLEKVWRLLGLLKLIDAHPFLGPRVALKGGTALNLFVFDLLLQQAPVLLDLLEFRSQVLVRLLVSGDLAIADLRDSLQLTCSLGVVRLGAEVLGESLVLLDGLDDVFLGLPLGEEGV